MVRKMTLKSALKKNLPAPIVETIRSLRGTAAWDPYKPIVLGEKDRAETRARFAEIDWHPDAPRRIIYGLIPTASLRNVGDHAQVVAIRQWIARHYPGEPVVELDKNVIIGCRDEIVSRVRANDLVFLHSGGNLGDRGLWSETARRTMIEALPDNRVVSLPQTIFFSETPLGRYQKQVSQAVYGRHGHLTVMGRDDISGSLAGTLFPRAQVITMPDFVLSLRKEEFTLAPQPENAGKIMACLRLDDESVFAPEDRLKVVERIGIPATLFDTTLDAPIEADARYGVVRDTLALFDAHEAVVTDRFHGLIFGVICRKPVVVLRTVDHKLTSAVAWFKDIPNVQFCDHLDDLAAALERVRATPVETYPDFNALYFDRLPGLVEEMERCAGEPPFVMPAVPSPQGNHGRQPLNMRSVAGKAKRRLLRAAGMTAPVVPQLKSFGSSDPDKLSDDELLAFMRHDAHRIEKSFYNRIFHAKRDYYEERRKNVRDCIALLKQRGHDMSEPTIAWADLIASRFENLEREFIEPNSTAARAFDPFRMDAFIGLAATRRSSRVWATQQPSGEELTACAKKLIDAARWAPNSGDRQPWRFLIMTDPAEKHLLKHIKEQHCYDAPCLIFVGGDRRFYGGLGENEAGLHIDGGAAIMQMVLAAHAGNFGVCWNHFSRDLIESRPRNQEIYAEFARKMRIPDHIEPVAVIAFGAAAFHPPVPPRMAVESLLIGDDRAK
ncbi:hypothetical protein MesoLjLb_59720 [Mesorhizobium sp. L-8-3]|nr:hypothetical protein MesoLjLb_59720 [Mesorhizobium sp. L-8-3]